MGPVAARRGARSRALPAPVGAGRDGQARGRRSGTLYVQARSVPPAEARQLMAIRLALPPAAVVLIEVETSSISQSRQ